MNDQLPDEQLDRLLRAARQESPPPVPRDEMWAAISARRQPPRGILRFRPWSGSWSRTLAWPAGLAAVLALGFALGRLSHESPPSATLALPTPADAPSRLGSPALAGAAMQHLSRAEIFLTGFRLEAGQKVPDAALLTGGRDLLGTTRLLLDSPQIQDARLRSLLQELEVVLAQVIQLQSEPSREDTDILVRQLDDNGMLPRLRTAIPSGPAVKFIGES